MLFCPKCGAPAEISSRPESIGGRQMASAGRSARTGGTSEPIDGKVFSSGDLFKRRLAERQRKRNVSFAQLV